MKTVRWGMIGCGDVAEVKSGPGFQNAPGSALVAVTSRSAARAADYARRHGVPRVHDSVDALVADAAVDAVYIATPPSSHLALALTVAAAGKPCLVEKPMAMNHKECRQMVEAFRRVGAPLWVAYYRRALPRFLLVRDLLRERAIGTVTSARVEVSDCLAAGPKAQAWRFDPAIAGAGLFFDWGSHCVDLLEFFLGPIVDAEGVAVNTGGAYPVEDVTAAVFRFSDRLVGSGLWNFNGSGLRDTMTFTGTRGEIVTPIFTDGDVIVRRPGATTTHEVRNPPHVHQPLIQTIVDELHGRGRCESTGESGARASWVLDRCVENFYSRPSQS